MKTNTKKNFFMLLDEKNGGGVMMAVKIINIFNRTAEDVNVIIYQDTYQK